MRYCGVVWYGGVWGGAWVGWGGWGGAGWGRRGLAAGKASRGQGRRGGEAIDRGGGSGGVSASGSVVLVAVVPAMLEEITDDGGLKSISPIKSMILCFSIYIN